MRINVNGWAEYGLSYGRVLKEEEYNLAECVIVHPLVRQIKKIADFNSIVKIKKTDINSVLDKAIEFYAKSEDYDLCQMIKNLKV